MFRFVLVTVSALLLASPAVVQAEEASPSLRMIVMDPLAAPLSCPCVEGYAQRKYEVLAKHLEKTIGREVQLVFAESLAKGLKETGGQADLIIGKDSVIRFDAEQAKVSVQRVGQLTDKQGNVTQHGLIVAASEDPAKSVKDLQGYSVLFGPKECDEKHSAAIQLLKSNGIPVASQLQIDGACSDGACKVLKLGPEGKTVAVISSYAAPLLEGCGTIKKGDLKVIGKTQPVRFVSAFTTDTLDEKTAKQVSTTLLTLVEHPEICTAIESLVGFTEPADDEPAAGASATTEAGSKKKS